jgi:hypothetical protein
MATVKATKDANLLKPLVLSGSAVEEDRKVKDQNDANKPDESEWLKRAKAQNGASSAIEVSFFTTLRERVKGAK